MELSRTDVSAGFNDLCCAAPEVTRLKNKNCILRPFLLLITKASN